MALARSSEDISTFPTVEVGSEVFDKHPDAAFWIGRVAASSVVFPEAESPNSAYLDALGHFRANVYVHEKNYLDPSVLDEYGREFDEYDSRSTQFVVIENIHESNMAPRMVGSIRMIQKESQDDLYPIEKYFPELFDEPIDVDSAEVSRFIASYPEDKRFMQHVIALALIRAATLFAVKEGISSYYCIIEEPLYKSLNNIGIPLETLGESKYIPEQGGTLYPICIKAKEIINSVTTDKTGSIVLRDFFEQEIGSGGEGYYPTSLIGGTYE